AVMEPAWVSPASASALPWPKRCSVSAGDSAVRTATKVISEPTRSSDESISDDSMLTESVASQATTLAPIMTRATDVEATVAAFMSDPEAVLIVSSWVEGACRPRSFGRSATVFQPIVQAERAVLPELDQQRLQTKARPVRRPRHAADHVPCGELGDPLLQGEA